MLTSTEGDRSARAIRISRRAGLAVGLAAALSGTAAVAGAAPALASAPTCGQEHAYVYQTQEGGYWNGPSIDSANPGTITISNSATDYRWVFAAGVHRPRRSIDFTFTNQDGAIVKYYSTTPSDDGGVVHQQDNDFKYDFTQPGWSVRVTAVIHTRCGGDDVPKTVFVGTINTTA